jgi:hypothetical protein
MKRMLLAVTGVVVALAMWVPATAATAGAAGTVGCYVGCVAPTSIPVQPSGPVVHAVSVTPAASVTPPSPVSTSASTALGSSSLPFTGADVVELAVIAMVLIAVGWAMARRRRALG